VSLADKASDGEKLLILANEAGANGDTVKQKDYLDKLVTAYPNDERAQFNLANYYFGQQELNPAVEHYRKATEIAPLTRRLQRAWLCLPQQGDYTSAERAFKKYIALIPTIRIHTIPTRNCC